MQALIRLVQWKIRNFSQELISKQFPGFGITLSASDVCDHPVIPGSIFTNHSQEHSLSFSPRFANWNVTQLLIG